MNILMFLIPKSEVDCLYVEETLGECFGRMEKNFFGTYPLISHKSGKYIGTITEGDILRDVGHRDAIMSVELSSPISRIKRIRDYQAVRVDAEVAEVFDMAITQNFVPVVDDSGIFIGIVKRSGLLRYVRKNFKSLEPALFGLPEETGEPAEKPKA